MKEQDIEKAINAEVERLYGIRRRQSLGHQQPVTGSVPIGAFGNLMGATVSVVLDITVDGSVTPVAVVSCSGFGCVDPIHSVPQGGRFLECDHGQLTHEGRLKACKWAQTHAEQCRALPR
jgi:hypothetical protein